MVYVCKPVNIGTTCEALISFHHAGPGNQAEYVRFDGKCLKLQNRRASSCCDGLDIVAVLLTFPNAALPGGCVHLQDLLISLCLFYDLFISDIK